MTMMPQGNQMMSGGGMPQQGMRPGMRPQGPGMVMSQQQMMFNTGPGDMQQGGNMGGPGMVGPGQQQMRPQMMGQMGPGPGQQRFAGPGQGQQMFQQQNQF